MDKKSVVTPDGAEYWFEEGCYILELSNSPDDPDVSIARARVPAGGGTRWHCLEGIAERYVIIDGRGSVELEDAQARNVGPGDVVLIPAGCPQRIVNRGASELVFLAICTPRFVHHAYRDLEENPDETSE